MTDIKIRAIRDTKAPYTDITAAKGEVLHFISNSRSASGEPWVRVKHSLARGEEVYFEAKDFELVSAFNTGDTVVTSARVSNVGQRLSADAVYTLEDFGATDDYCGIRRNGTGVYYSVPVASLTHYTPKPQGAVKAVAKRNNPGWTFRAAPSDFDGPRILRELEAQGAQYAVIVWGKGQDERLAVVSQGLFDRMDELPDSTLPNAVGASYYRVTDFGPGRQLVEDTSETVAGWHESTRPDGTPCKLSDLRALVARVAAWEQANAKVRVYVAYGASGGE